MTYDSNAVFARVLDVIADWKRSNHSGDTAIVRLVIGSSLLPVLFEAKNIDHVLQVSNPRNTPTGCINATFSGMFIIEDYENTDAVRVLTLC